MNFSDEEKLRHHQYIQSDAYKRMREEVLSRSTVNLYTTFPADVMALHLAKAEGIREAFRTFEALSQPDTQRQQPQPRSLIKASSEPAS